MLQERCAVQHDEIVVCVRGPTVRQSTNRAMPAYDAEVVEVAASAVVRQDALA